VSAVQPEVATPRPAARWRPRGRHTASWLVPCLYLAGAVLLTWRLWADPAWHAPLKEYGVDSDVDLFAWFMRYSATAVMHGRLPALVTTALNAPEGINLMWNTPFLVPGVLLAPVTALAGPQTSLTIVVTLGFAGSAAALFFVLRRWGCSVWPAALGGALYGFSPALLDAAPGHYDFQFAVLPPLIIDALLRIVTGRGRPVRTGAWLGLLMAAQLFTGEELLVDTMLAGLLAVLVLAVSRPRTVPGRVRGALAGLAAAAAVVLVTCGHALWVQLHGPLIDHGSPWPTSLYKNLPHDFVIPPSGLLFHLQASAAELSSSQVHLTEYLAYLGWPLLAILLIAAVRYWRDPRVRVTVVTFAVLELCSLGTSTVVFPGGLRYPAFLLPWYWLHGLPVLKDMLVDRLSVVADGAAAATLAFSLDLTRPATAQAPRWQRILPAALAVLAVAPLLPLPIRAAEVTPAPAGWHAAFARLHLAPDASVLVVPMLGPQTMRWQAQTGEPGSLIGGYCIAPDPQTGYAKGCRTGKGPVARYLNELAEGSPYAVAPSRAAVSAYRAYWNPAAVVAVTRQNSRLGRFLSRLFGKPTAVIDSLLVWQHPTAAAATAPPKGAVTASQRDGQRTRRRDRDVRASHSLPVGLRRTKSGPLEHRSPPSCKAPCCSSLSPACWRFLASAHRSRLSRRVRCRSSRGQRRCSGLATPQRAGAPSFLRLPMLSG
jgi:hypothetical protein